MFNGSISNNYFEKPSWAAVLRSGQGDIDTQKSRDVEAKIKEYNKKKDRARKEFEDFISEYERHDLGHGMSFHNFFELIYLF